MLARIMDELLLLVRRLRRSSSGSRGDKPQAFAYRLRMSVRLITPMRRPLTLAPGRAAAGTARLGLAGVKGGPGVGETLWLGRTVGMLVEGIRAGDAGTDDAGEAVSTTHMRCERVATSLATVCASVLYGVT